MTKLIQLTRGVVTSVDDEDYDRFGCFRWQVLTCRGGQMYAKRIVNTPTGRHAVYLHRAILDAPAGVDVDHRDRDGLNNRKSNLRLATRSQNNGNAGKRKDGRSSTFRGVSWSRRDRRWHAQIGVAGLKTALGDFASETEAARAYDAAAVVHFGAFAAVNFPPS